MPIKELARVIDNRQVVKDHFKLTISSDYISTHAVPGQFVEIRVSNDTDPLLRRPFCFHSINKDGRTVDILYRVVGKATKLLTQYQIGSEIDVMGPLGNGFKLDKTKDVAVFVGGGAGIAPLLAAAQEAKKIGIKAVYAILGMKNRNMVLCEAAFKELGVETIITTDDGSYGRKGLASDILLELLSSHLSSLPSHLYACGPKPMLKAISEIAQQRKLDCQLSLEEWMACGIGACKGCAVKTRSGYKMVCKDGPVFDAKEIIWR